MIDEEQIYGGPSCGVPRELEICDSSGVVLRQAETILESESQVE